MKSEVASNLNRQILQQRIKALPDGISARIYGVDVDLKKSALATSSNRTAELYLTLAEARIDPSLIKPSTQTPLKKLNVDELDSNQAKTHKEIFNFCRVGLSICDALGV